MRVAAVLNFPSGRRDQYGWAYAKASRDPLEIPAEKKGSASKRARFCRLAGHLIGGRLKL